MEPTLEERRREVPVALWQTGNDVVYGRSTSFYGPVSSGEAEGEVRRTACQMLQAAALASPNIQLAIVSRSSGERELEKLRMSHDRRNIHHFASSGLVLFLISFLYLLNPKVKGAGGS